MNDFKKMADEHRRNFLKFVAKAGVSIPVLQASTLAMGVMSSRFAMAQTATNKVKRVIFVFIPGGTPGKATKTFTPTGSNGALVMNSCSQPMDAYKQNCVFIKNASIVAGNDVAGGHGLTYRVLGAFNGSGTTVDNVLAQSVVGASSRFGSLRLGVIANSATGATLDCSISSVNTWTQSTYVSNPRTVFNSLFTGGASTGSTAQQQQLKIYDVNLAALSKIRNQLSAEEQLRVDENIAAIQKLKTDLNNSTTTTGGACTNPAWDNFGTVEADPMLGAHFTQLFDQQARNAALALACNLTKVVSIQMGTDGGNFAATGFTDTYHGSIHGGKDEPFIQQRAYLQGRVASLINILKTTPDETGAPLFNSTLIVQLSDMSNGQEHTGDDAPLLLASGSSLFKGHQVVAGSTHTQLLDNAAEAVGLTGYTPYSAGSIKGIWS